MHSLTAMRSPRARFRRADPPRLVAAVVASLAFIVPCSVQPQHAHGDTTARLSLGAMGVLLVSRSPGPLSTTVSEGYITQPMAFATLRSSGGRLVAYATVNAEGATLRRGEINPGVYGEGYVDRRHPHTWFHELMVGARGGRDARWSLFAGKGFVPYGTDDPMVRPFVKYPVNHHHAQVLERAMVTGSLSWKGVTLEASSFNGDEPESPTDWPNADRRFDSWAARLTVQPVAPVELSASAARVASPEFAAGFGLDQRKEAASIRFANDGSPLEYALVEYASTREFSGPVEAFAFSTWLAEARLAHPRAAIALRAERTTRPEEERAGSFFRTVRPHHDFNTLGRTRWTIVTANVTAGGGVWHGVAGRPFIEIAHHVPRATRLPTALDPIDVFGRRSLWMGSLGLRVHAGAMRRRFGRYSIPQ